MIKSRLVSLGALVLSAAVLLSACGSGNGGSSTNSSASTPTDSSTTQSESAKLKGDLVYWSMWNETEAQAEVITAAINDFQKKNADVKITVQWNGRDIRKTLKPALDAGQVIDIWDEDTERVVKNYQDNALKLDSYLDKTYPETEGKTYKESVMGSLIDLAASYSTDKGVYAIPYQPMMIAFMYNKDHFAKAGISSVPKTWAEFTDACAKLKEAGFIPLTNDDAYIDLPLGYHLSRYIGQKQVEELVKDKSGAKWDDPKVFRAIKDYEELASKGYISSAVATNKWPAGQQEIATGKVSMYLNGTWLPNEIKDSTGPDFNWGQFSYPAVEGGAEGTDAANYGAQAFQINKACKAPDTAFTFIASLTTGKWDKELSEKTLGAPMSITNEWPKQIADEKEMFSSLKICYPWGAGAQADSDKSPILNSNFTKLCVGQITAEQFISNVKSNKQ